MRCVCLPDSKPSLRRTLRRKPYPSGRLECIKAAAKIKCHRQERPTFSQGPRLHSSSRGLVRPLDTALLYIQLVGGEKKVQGRIAPFSPAWPWNSLTSLPLTSSSTVQNLLVSPHAAAGLLCGFLVKACSLYHTSKIFKSSPTQCDFIHNDITICNILSSHIKLGYIFRQVKMAVFKLISLLIS